jgi:hypothetical protein
MPCTVKHLICISQAQTNLALTTCMHCCSQLHKQGTAAAQWGAFGLNGLSQGERGQRNVSRGISQSLVHSTLGVDFWKGVSGMILLGAPVLGVREDGLVGGEVQRKQPGALLSTRALVALLLGLRPASHAETICISRL